jgi:Na+-translocating ferredoxin:NAD+ oxidoreductase RnfC subunit
VASAVVAAGEAVKAGQAVGRVSEGALGADIHASISGKVAAVTPEYVEIER